ncbi:hypothetical protein BST81_02605 [Leptolyngbya sp. 'hensonii']|uniref:hypothetical protein n=1 Tax=Leptolyngbya sp. 'hensonii' TaxID=1922337 RepID=UPI00094F73CA|nr:hypothetical protein [Leptolyngbya sp. 'hensonii']OLP19982.1 hypothetical protein BST81_02605 [Leptolyngbya sp. 'hensonii']
MTKALSPSQQALAQRSAEAELEAKRMQDIRLLLENLGLREEATIKLIIECLYDVGSVNLINQKIRRRRLNRLMKSVSRLSRPVFRMIAIRWFHKNCPQLIADWLQRKVSFKEASAKKPPRPATPLPASGPPPRSALASASAITEQEILELRSQVKRLNGMLLGTIVLLGGTTLWLAYRSDPHFFHPITQSVQFLWQDRCDRTTHPTCDALTPR